MQKNRGQIIVEALVAMTIIVVGLLGILSLVTRSFALTKTVADQYAANSLAAEGLEIVKNLLSRNVEQTPSAPFDAGISTGSFCVTYIDTSLGISIPPCPHLRFDSSTGLYSYAASGVETPFTRTVDIDIDPDGDGIFQQFKVVSRVMWSSRGQDFEVKIEDRFYDSKIPN